MDKYNIEKRHIYEGLQGARWPGRFEVVSLKPYIILDGSHNPQGISSLRDSINELFNKNKKAFIMSVMKDKDYAGMVKEISRIADMFVLVNSSNERALKTEALADEIKKYCNNIVVSDTIDNAMRIALDYVSIDGLVCVTGTFSIISEARDVLNYYKI